MGDEEQQINARCQLQPFRADGGARNCGYFRTVFTESQPVGPAVQYRFKHTAK